MSTTLQQQEVWIKGNIFTSHFKVIFYLYTYYKEVERRLDTNRTILRINAEKFYMKGSKEVLVFDFQNLMVSVGGYLGLFIGLSLNDVTNSLIDTAGIIFRKFTRTGYNNEKPRNPV